MIVGVCKINDRECGDYDRWCKACPKHRPTKPALTAELKAELLEALRIGEKAKLEQLNLIPASGPKSYEIFALKYSLDQIHAVIEKLEAIPTPEEVK